MGRRKNKNNHQRTPQSSSEPRLVSTKDWTLVELINLFNALYDPSRAQEETVAELIDRSPAGLLTYRSSKISSSLQGQQDLFQVVLIVGRKRIHRIAFTANSLALARAIVLKKAFAWLSNLSFLVATFKAHYHENKSPEAVMRPLSLPGLIFVETVQSSTSNLWSTTLKIIGRRSDMKSGQKATPEEAEASVFEEAVAYIKEELADCVLDHQDPQPAPYIFNTSYETPEFQPEYPPPMPDHLDWLGKD